MRTWEGLFKPVHLIQLIEATIGSWLNAFATKNATKSLGFLLHKLFLSEHVLLL